MQLKVQQEWCVQLKMKDGNYQEVQGLTLGNVCAPMPIFDTTAAVKEIKASDPGNSMLQECCVPKQNGGHVQ